MPCQAFESFDQEAVYEIGARSLEAEAGFGGGESDLEEGEEDRGGKGRRRVQKVIPDRLKG